MSRIMKKRYGKQLVIDTGSERRQHARIRSCLIGKAVVFGTWSGGRSVDRR